MRKIDWDFKSCATLCWVWVLTLKDGAQLGFTDHNRGLNFQGVSCRSESGFTQKTTGVCGVLSSDITAADIRAGKLVESRLQSYRVNWTNPNEYVPIATGHIGEVTQKGESFELEWQGQATRLDRSTGRVFSRTCDAEFGDARCGLNPADFPEGTICPRTFTACRDQFSNTLNFRGFPYLIGDDAMAAAPLAGALRDGGSRYS